MQIDAAVKLIERGVLKDKIQTWADLGAGSGLFTNALSTLLPKNSSIIAIDKKPSKITIASDVHLQTKTGDFLSIDFGRVDGVLMANALHYVKDQKDFIDMISAKAKRLVLVEYDTDHGNQWVPYPISFTKLRSLYPNAKQIGSEVSAYHKEGMYSALLLF